jgi:thiol-disulfide isomerase/thioredoxin
LAGLKPPAIVAGMKRISLGSTFLFGWVVSLVCTAAPLPPTLSLGSAAPEFKLPGADGRTHALQDFASSKILVIICTCNHCPTAQYYEERVKKLVTDYREKGVAFVAISPNDAVNGVRPDELGYTDLGDSLEEMKIRAKHRAFNLPYLYGGGEYEPVSRAYGPVATPHTFVFDAERKLRYVGRIDDSERERFVKSHDLRNALEALLAGQEPPVTQTKVFGCSIKWSDKAAEVKRYWDKFNAEPVTVEPVNAEGLRRLRENKSADNKGKLRLVNVWATWCGPCATEFPDLMDIYRWYRQRDFELVTVAAQYPDEKEEVLKFLKKHHASGKNFCFGDTEKYKLLEAFDPDWNGALPYSVLVDPEGKILFRQQGTFDPLELRRLIVAELNKRKPW